MINVAVEGPSDEELARSVVRAAGREVGKVAVKRGKTNLDPMLPRLNVAARHVPWIAFRDSDTKCPLELRDRLLGGVGELCPTFLLRIVHPMSEAWLLADAAGFAEFFGVSAGKVPLDVESLQNPKQTLLSLCEKSRLRSIREDVVLPDGRTGPLYTYRINEFAASAWSAERAGDVSDSLARAIRAISEMPVVQEL